LRRVLAALTVAPLFDEAGPRLLQFVDDVGVGALRFGRRLADDGLLLGLVGGKKKLRGFAVELLLDPVHLGRRRCFARGRLLQLLAQELACKPLGDWPQSRRQAIERELQHAVEERLDESFELVEQRPEAWDEADRAGDALLRHVDDTLDEAEALLEQAAEEVLEVRRKAGVARFERLEKTR